MKAAPRLIAAAFAFAFLTLHLASPSRSLEDLDSINFALGIRDYDVAEHQPHPPGYPVFMLAAKGVNAVVRSEPLTLSLMAMAAGALAAFGLVGLFGALEPRLPSGVVTGAAGLTLAAPLFWVTAARPLSDMPGLAAVLFLQWLIVTAAGPRDTAVAAALAGFGAGVRSQVVWLTVPLIALTVWRQRRDRLRLSAISLAAYAAGALAWGLPLVLVSGGAVPYWRAVAFQGSADLSGVTMLWTTPTVRQLAEVIQSVLVAPWAWWPLAVAVLILAAAGAAHLAARSRAALLTLAAAFAPYLVFHALFQETVTTRYAVPLVVPVAYLAVRGAAALAPGLGPWIAAGLAVVAVSIGHASLVAYSADAAPAFRMLAEMRAEQHGGRAEAPVLAMHRRQEFDLRRPFRWNAPDVPAFAARLPSPPRREWLELVKYWNDGGRAPVWFISDPLRSDLALVHHRGPRRSYRWPMRFPHLIGGVRPSVMDWYELRDPAWYLGEGWALTPETAGVAAATGRGPARGGSVGWIRRTATASTLLIGGRHHPGGAATARLRVAIDGRVAEDTQVPPGFFLRVLRLPPGALSGPGDYAALTVTSDRDELAIEQFDAQPAGTVVFGFGEGWHEHEYQPSTGARWRWTSEHAVLRIRAEGHALAIRLRGESEADGESHVVLRAGGRVVAEKTVEGAFVLTATVPAAAVGADDTVMTIETDNSYVPADRGWGSGDRRRLGLKIFECDVSPAS